MLFNKEKNIKYLGFDDTWFVIIGLLVVSFLIDFLLQNSFGTLPFEQAIVSWSISLFFATCNWMFMRTILIFLRKKYPKLTDSKKRILLLFLFMVSSIVLIDYAGNLILGLMHGSSYNPIDRVRLFLPVLMVSVMLQAIYEAIYHHERLKISIREEEQSKQMIVQAKLDALRNQARPHFLFNTLNTLRDIIDQDPKEEAKIFVDKISNVYRFILESGNENLCSLRDELKFSKSYIHIQKERFGENLKVVFEVAEDQLDKLIVPMSLQLLLENAIKHNVISMSKPLTINVLIENGRLKVENKIQAKSSALPSTKLGLKNIESRYALLSDLKPIIENDGVNFTVSLPLLNSIKTREL